MEYLAENPAPVWALGAVLLTLAVIYYAFTRTGVALGAVLGVLLLTGLGVAAERWVVTPREQVQHALQALLQRVEADDLPGVLAMVSLSASDIRGDAQSLMPMFDIRKARSTGEVDVVMQGDTQADAEFRFFTDVRHVRSGHRGGYWDDVTISFAKQNDRWVITGYSTQKNWRADAARL